MTDPGVDAVTLITGASSGIGAATARRLAAPAQGLLLHARGADAVKLAALETVAGQCRERGAAVATELGDLAQPGVAARLADAAAARFGRLDKLVSNAGFALAGDIEETGREQFDLSYRVIAAAFAELVAAALPQLRRSRRARIVAVSSFVAHQTPGGQRFPATALAKGALEALARTLAAELAGAGITVNCVAPGFTRKEQTGHSALSAERWRRAAALTPNGRLAEPDDIANAVAFFLDDAASHVTGQTLKVDGGLSLL